MSKLRKVIIVTIVNVIVVALVFLIFEGFSSTILVANKLFAGQAAAERLHTEYDQTLGWVNRPNLYIEDMYGPEKYLRTNGQSFRNNKDFEITPPGDSVRIICLGDSFTLGYGVDNDHTWCQQLVTIDHRLETVNMGQGGYGIDQAYLWYKRDGVKLDHDIQIFAFITFDFKRMQQDEFLGYGKPVLELHHGALVTENVPVPEPSSSGIWLNRNRPIINELDSVRLLQQLFVRAAPKNSHPDDDYTRQVALKIFQDLQQINQTKGSSLVLVYLPIEGDFVGNSSEVWRQFLRVEAEQHGLIFIDLVSDFRKLPPELIRSLFIPPGEIDFPAASGHYSEQGNALVARTLYDKMLEIPELSEKLTP